MRMRPKPVRSFARGLVVLEALNQNGSATALAIARQTKVPRGTVYRLLQTLQDAGYIERGAGDDRFRLKFKVRSLSAGFEDEQWIAQIARPSLLELTRRISWPCDVLTFQDLHMVIRDTTHPRAPFSIDRNMIGREIPMLGSAAGLVYLACAPAGEQTQILAMLAKAEADEHAHAFDLRSLERIIAATRQRGYGVRQGGPTWPHTGAIALPIRHDGRVLGCISVIWMARVIDEQNGVRLCLDPLREVQAAIEGDLASMQGV